jgi:hypothetical protein
MGQLTANGLDPVSAVSLAARLNFDEISLRLLPAGPGDTPPPLLADTGLTMSEAEMIRLGAGTDLETVRPFLERITAMGASGRRGGRTKPRPTQPDRQAGPRP